MLSLVLFAAGLALLLPVTDWLLALLTWTRGAGALGMGAFALTYVLATVLALPASVLTLGAGFVWGPALGSALVIPSATIGATLAFLVARRGLREDLLGRVRAEPRFAAVDRAVSARGFTAVALIRLSPVFPFNLVNYALGLTAISLRDYVLATALGIAPAVVVYTFLGSAITELAELAAGRATAHPAQQALFWGGLLATIAVTAFLARTARDALSEMDA